MEPVTSEKDSHNVESNSNLDGNPIESDTTENCEKRKILYFVFQIAS